MTRARRIQAGGRLVAAACIAHAVLAFYLAVTLNIWVDESYTLNTTGGGFARMIRQTLSFEGQPPLYFILLWVWRRLGDSVVWGRLLSILFTVSFLVVTGRACRRYVPRIHPGWIIAPLAFHPAVLYAAVELRTYALTLLLSASILLLFYDAFLAQTPSRRSLVLYGVVSVLALYNQYYLGFLLFANGLAVFATRDRVRIFQYYACMAAVGALFLPMALYVRAQAAIHQEQGYTMPPVSANARYVTRMLQEFIVPVRQLGVVEEGRWVVIGMLAVAFTAALLCGWRRVRRGHVALAIVVAVMMVWLVVLLTFLMAREWVQWRHAISLLAPTVLLTYAVIHLFRPPYRGRVLSAWTAVLAVCIVTASFEEYAPLAKRGDWKRVLDHIEGKESPSEAILVFPPNAMPIVERYYTGKNTVFTLPKEDDYRMYEMTQFIVPDEETVANGLTEFAPDARGIWYVSTCSPECVLLGADLRADRIERFLSERYERTYEVEFYRSRLVYYGSSDVRADSSE